MSGKTRIRKRRKHGFPPYPHKSFKDYNTSKREMSYILHFLTPVLAKSLEITKQIISKNLEERLRNEKRI